MDRCQKYLPDLEGANHQIFLTRKEENFTLLEGGCFSLDISMQRPLWYFTVGSFILYLQLFNVFLYI